jgi:putative sterol carrier protein
MPVTAKPRGRRTKDPTAAFFEELMARGHEPLLENDSGTLRFDLVVGRRVEHWYVAIDKGNVTVSHEEGVADSILRTDRSVFDRIAAGKMNAMAAVLRGELLPEGDLSLLVLFQRLFPGPPRSRSRRGTAGHERSGR